MKRNSVYFMLILFIISLVGCSGANETNQTETKDNKEVVIKHALGETKIKGTPKRIVAMEFSYVDALAKLNMQPVGITDDNDKNLIIKPIRDKIGNYTSLGSRYEPNIELILSVKPDLIIADTERFKGIYKDLSKIAPTILIDSWKSDYKSSLEAFNIIAKAVGKEKQGSELLKEHEQKMNELAKNAPKNDAKKILPAVVNNEAMFGHSASSFAGSLLQQYGMKNAIPNGEAFQKMNLEQLVKLDPDALFLMKGTDHTILEKWQDNPLWKNLKAVKNKQVFDVDRSTWSLSRGLIGSEEVLKEAQDLLNQQ